MKTLDKPRIYVACLAAYNDGYLHGAWIDAAQSGDEIREEVEAMLRESPIPLAEEWAIHGYEGFAGIKIDEWDSFDHVSDIAHMLTKGDHNPDLVAGVYEHLGSGTTPNQVHEFIDDCYQGEFEDLGEWAENFLGETGGLEGVPKHLTYYIDFDGYGRDAEISGDIFTIGGHRDIHVFWNR